MFIYNSDRPVMK